MIGAIGTKEMDDIILFEVSDQKTLTFESFARTNKVRYAKHDLHLQKPLPEFTGPELDNITLRIILKAEFGVNPRAEMDKLIYIQRDGITISIIIGTGGFGYYRWTIQDLSMVWERMDNKGILMAASCDLTLQEYV